LERQRGQLLEDVGLLQAALLPVPPPRLGPVSASVAYRPADGPGAGGDFYDVFALEDGRVAAIVGDISGHGRQALPHTALVRFTLRAYLEAGLTPREALRTAGEVLERQLGESFATVAIAAYQPRSRLLTYATAGHPPPLIVGSRRVEPVTVCAAPPIGVGMRTGTRQTVVSVPGAARVCLYTDGVTEARTGSELFGVERLQRTLSTIEGQAPAAELLDQVAQRTDARPDDMATCLLSIDGCERAPTKLLEELELDAQRAGGDRVKRFLLDCGVPRLEVAAILPATRAEAQRVGAVCLKVQLDGVSPRVTLRPDNVAPLYVGRTRQVAVGGGSA
jgi:hypothetical protein